MEPGLVYLLETVIPYNFHHMDYIHHVMKSAESVKEVEIRAIDAVRGLLRDVPGVHVRSVEHERKIGRDRGVDGRVAFSHRDGSHALVVEVRPDGAPRFVRAGIYRLESRVARLRRSGEAEGGTRLIPMIVSPYLSPESRAVCLDHDTAYLDLVGNARLAFDAVYIERAVAERPRLGDPCPALDLLSEGGGDPACPAA